MIAAGKDRVMDLDALMNTDFNQLLNMDISGIWELSDQTSFVIAMGNWVGRKSDYGKNMDILTHEEQTFLICHLLEEEVNNGGFSQYLFNSAGNHANRAAASMEEIGAHKTAEICRRAIGAFQRNIPTDRTQRQEFLDEYLTDEVDAILCKCDDRFYQCPDDLEQLTYIYILAHKEAFA